MAAAEIREETTAARARRIYLGWARPFRAAAIALRVGLIISVVVAVVAGIASGLPFAGAAVGSLAGFGVLAITLGLLSTSDSRAAWELVCEHQAYEVREFRRRYGRRMPAGWAAIRSAAERFPDKGQRAVFLIMLGQLERADAILADVQPTTADERLGLELAKQASALVADRPLDRSALQTRLDEIGEPDIRRHREHCVGLHDALVAVANREDQVPTLAAAWRRGQAAAVDKRGFGALDGQLFWILVAPIVLGFFAGMLPKLIG